MILTGGIPSVDVSNVLSEEKKQQVIALGRLGWSLRRIEASSTHSAGNGGGYLRAAGIAVRPPGGWGRRGPAKPANEVTPDSGAESAPITVPEPHSDRRPLGQRLRAVPRVHRTGLSRWPQRHGDLAGPGRQPRLRRRLSERQALRRQAARHQSAPEACAVIETAPGEEAQVDYGAGPMVRDPHTGKYRRTRLFVLTLGYSRKSVRLLVFRSSTRIWAELHEKAFRRLGGATRVVVLDNLREGVLTPDIYDPALNPLYRDLLPHYGAVALPCRVGDPDRKGKVERASATRRRHR